MEKILIVNSYYAPNVIGGAEICTQALAENLVNKYEVHVLSVGMHRNKIISEVINGVTVHRLPNTNIYSPLAKKSRTTLLKLIWHINNLFNPINTMMISNFIKKLNPILISTQNLIGIGTGIWKIANKLSIPVIHTIHDNSLIEPTKNNYVNYFCETINKRRGRLLSGVSGVSDFILTEHKSNGFFMGITSKVIYNVSRAPSYKNLNKDKNNELVLGYFGSLEESKGINLLLHSLKGLDKKLVKELIICGEGSYEDIVKAEALRDQRIKYYGRLPSDEVYKKMSVCDVVVVPSKNKEAFGMVIIEAYRQGVPVIASAVGGIVEIIYSKDYLFDSNIESLRASI
ncbi:glycosyltransferase, partial [Peribacillus frigoritolerans]|uniref:glycosyltransferase n=1 Tax=Peribacillus frigoritolerans TaxID=450367 RepID=UPI003008FD6F